jgi:ribosomal protein S1
LGEPGSDAAFLLLQFLILPIAMNIGQSPDSASQPVQQPDDASQVVSDQGESAAATSSNPTSSSSTSMPSTSLARGKGPLASRGASAKPESPVAKPLSPAARAAHANRSEQDRSAQRGGERAQSDERAQPGESKTADGGDAAGEVEHQQKPQPAKLVAGGPDSGDGKHRGDGKQRGDGGQRGDRGQQADEAAPARPAKLAVPNLRQPLPGDIQAELDRELAAAEELDAFLSGSAGMAPRKEPLQDGQRVHGTVLKIQDDSVFVALGGPDEGVVPLEQFTAAEPTPGAPVEVIIRGLSSADGLYVLTLPGEAIDVSDWSDIEAGSVVEATVTGANSGGLECKVAGISGFIPISQISEHRVEDTSEFIDQKFICIVTEANPRRGNLVLSRRAVLEREREDKRKEQLEKIEPGDLLEGIVRTVKDFGAFVDLGGLEGLIHVSKLSWERIKHPSEVIEPGQKVKVKVDKIDKQTGKISLSYRDLLENPWDSAAETITPGAVLTGTVTRTTAFGAFVRLSAGVEGLVHISEIAGHRVSNVAAFLSEGQEVQAKVLSVDRESQKISLSIKQAHHKPAEETSAASEEEIEVREPIIKATHQGPLRGGNDQATGGERFGLRW